MIDGLHSKSAEAAKKIVVIAGKPSHPPGMHEFNAGVQLLEKCLREFDELDVKIVLNGWPKDEAIFDGAAAIIFYMDGGPKHEVVQEEGRRLKMVDEWAKKGVGLGFMHYGVEIVPEQASDEFKRWIGGHYEKSFSCNPMWEPNFTKFPKHAITRGVKPFKIEDEWYINMRFVSDISGIEKKTIDGMKFTPILVAPPSDKTRNGPYVWPAGPYAHIQANKGRAEAVMWAVVRNDGGRGFGFTGGHFHKNWGNDEFRKVVLNAFAWVAKVKVPKDGIESTVSERDLNANLDPKPARR